MRLELRQLRLVVALDRWRNFARAAETLGMTQSALSRALQTLEDGIGAKLFDRDRSRVEPTAVGAALIERARPLLESAKRIEQDLSQLVDMTGGLLRVGAGPFPAETSVGLALGRLLKAHPGLRIDLSIDDWPELTSLVLAGDIEIAVADADLALPDERLSVEPLPSHSGVFFCRPGHPLTRQPTPSIDDLRAYPIVMTSIPHRLEPFFGARPLPTRAGAQSAIATLDVRVEALAPGRQIVQESDAVGIALPPQIKLEVETGRLVVLPIAFPWMSTAYGIIRLSDRALSPAAEKFLVLLREVEHEIGPTS